MKDLRVKQILEQQSEGQEIRISCWVRTKRDSKGVCFLELNDGSCMKNLQAVIDKESFGDLHILEMISTGASVEISGVLKESPGKNQTVELLISSCRILGEAPQDFLPAPEETSLFRVPTRKLRICDREPTPLAPWPV